MLAKAASKVSLGCCGQENHLDAKRPRRLLHLLALTRVSLDLGIEERGDDLGSGNQIVQQRKPLCGERAGKQADAC